VFIILFLVKVHAYSGEALSEPPQNPMGDVLLLAVVTTAIFRKPTFIYVHIGQDGIIVLNLYCLRSLSLFNDKSTHQDYCIFTLHNKTSNTYGSDTFYQAPGISRQHI